MKNSQFILIILLNAFAVQAQQIITTTGDCQTNTSGSLSWTLGECVINTYTVTNIILTQGFQQSKLTATAIKEVPENLIEINAYPNPTADLVALKITTGSGQGVKYQLYDLYGKLLAEQKLVNSEAKISFNNLASGTYLLKIFNKDQELKVFKIIKK